MLLTSSEPSELLFSPLLLQRLARPAPPGVWPPPMQHLLWLPKFPFPGGVGGGHRWGTLACGTLGLSLTLRWRWLEWEEEEAGEGRLGQEGQLPTRFPWAAVPT